MNDRSDQGSNEEFVHMRNLLDQSLASAIDESCYHTGGILQEAMRYAVMSGGKRIRPILTIAVYQLFHRDFEAALPAACAVEFVHTASLIIDDLPCMDDASTRRFREVHHRVFGEDVTILTAMNLLNSAYALLIQYSRKERPAGGMVSLKLLDALNLAIGNRGLIGGQLNDLHSSYSGDSWNVVDCIHEKKTVQLFSFAAEAGALVAEATERQLEAIRAYAKNVGLALQVNDDALDQRGTPSSIGKDTNRDTGKQTFVSVASLEASMRTVNTLIDFAVSQLTAFGSRAEPLVKLPRLIMA